MRLIRIISEPQESDSKFPIYCTHILNMSRRTCIFILVILISLAVANASVYDKFYFEDNHNSVLVEAVCKIIDEIYLTRNLTVYITLEENANSSEKKNMEKLDLINDIIKQTPINTKFQIVKYNLLKSKKRYFNIFFVESYECFAKINEAITSDNFNFRGKFLIVFTIRDQNVDEEIKKIMAALWDKFITDIVVLIKSLHQKKAHLYAFFPFTKFYCGEVRPILWKIFANGGFKTDRPNFPENIQDLSNCSLKVASFNSPPFMKIAMKKAGKITFKGLDGKLLSTIASLMNFRVNLTYMIESEPQWGVLYPNGSSTGAMKKVRFC